MVIEAFKVAFCPDTQFESVKQRKAAQLCGDIEGKPFLQCEKSLKASREETRQQRRTVLQTANNKQIFRRWRKNIIFSCGALRRAI